jgi:hypothetical protein
MRPDRPLRPSLRLCLLRLIANRPPWFANMFEFGARFRALTVLALSSLSSCSSSDTGEGPRYRVAAVCDGGGCADAAPDRCPGPYTVERSDGECVWSCGEGTTPDAASHECVCKPGFVERATDRFGRRVCREVSAPSRE